ncbi:alkaline phosphatase [Robiginitomaculum antarcticum]|uniref:alkaline phosphatase n=1 Tax=Robiginitomaculum antarcticum TaxID=437507 RepID=UPI00037B6E6B|nr:alkaline phosphatase [Robiginitomaculum antarcticum]
MKRIFLVATFLTLAGCASIATGADVTSQAESKKPKNVILFIGDGMGVSTITAARIYEGQSLGKSGEEHSLFFETFPNVALVKTYNIDAQVPDSAGTASAINTGLVTGRGAINVQPGNLSAGCTSETQPGPVKIMDLAEASGMSTGVVSSASITHATPAAVYAHAGSRGFEGYDNLSEEALKNGCADIARQLVMSKVDVAYGGGRRFFTADKRKDNADLTREWSARGDNFVYVDTAEDFTLLDPSESQQVLGLFANSHLPYHVDRKDGVDPSLTELTVSAIDNLDGRGAGYFLMVEGGRIDHAHHGTNAFRALTDTVELASAVRAAYERTDPNETMILVTADHSHVFTIAGYPERGNPILGLAMTTDDDGTTVPLEDADGLPYTTLGYQNGPNMRGAAVLTEEMVQDRDYKQQTGVNMRSETHGGEDVILFGTGPGSERVRGAFHQSKIFDIIVDGLSLREE